MKYDVEAIRERVNNMIANLKRACDCEEWDIVENILCNPVYDEDDIPRVKCRYKVTLKRVLTNTIYVDAYDEDDAICTAQDAYAYRHSNMNEWDFDEDLEPEVEEED
jgi:hypothetical protein